MEDQEGLESTVDGNKIIVSGISKEKVGKYAAEIRDKRRPEPYKGRESSTLTKLSDVKSVRPVRNN